ncbi:MAG: dihydropteroate synthase [Desulfuromonadales bacterium]|nr:dihydropteroate synthase [Desulfuromonadales bacterium]MDT8422680.1 dihydropteroate synthase [Desulfuromonadales bacterium]
MTFAPRLLKVADDTAARDELKTLGVDPVGIERMTAKMLLRLVKIDRVPCRAANILKQEMLALGGDAAVARGTVACSLPTTDVILIGTLKQLEQLARRLGVQPFGLADLGQELIQLLDWLDKPATLLRGRTVELDLSRPRIMGILNATPDSFSDGGRYNRVDAALMRAGEMVAEGADLIDVGGESTRPGALAVSVEEELDRVIPIIEALHAEFALPLSIDTSKSGVAAAAAAAGVEFVNDISGLQFDAQMPKVVATSSAGLILMHTRGRPETMQHDTKYLDLTGQVISGLRDSLSRALAAGVKVERIAVDPGIGFGKDVAGNLELLRHLDELHSLGRPLLLGTSRKSFIGTILGEDDPVQRLHGSLATVALAVAAGVRLLRVHDVRASREAALTAWAVVSGQRP